MAKSAQFPGKSSEDGEFERQEDAFRGWVRADAVYHGHFKCNLRRIADYPNLRRLLRDLDQTPGIAETVNFDHIKRHYYVTHTEINPTQIVPIGPDPYL